METEGERWVAEVWTSAGPEADRRIDGLDTAATDRGTGSPPGQGIIGSAWEIMPAWIPMRRKFGTEFKE